MTAAYPGPLREEPLAVELHNTQYAVRGRAVDGLADAAGARAWVAGLAPRLPPQAAGDPGLGALRELRSAVRAALRAVVHGEPVPSSALAAINDGAAAAPASPLVRADLTVATRYDAEPADVLRAVLAADAIDLLTGPRRADLRLCGAPGCVLMYLKDHPRRGWCSSACGNRARQARHYARHRR